MSVSTVSLNMKCVCSLHDRQGNYKNNNLKILVLCLTAAKGATPVN